MPVPGSEMNIKYKWVIKFHCSNRKQAQGETNKQTNSNKKNKAKQNNTVNFSRPVSIYIKAVVVDVDLIKIPRVGVSFFPKVF